MLYAGADLDELTVVVLDEVHYLQDSYRGPVWEEVIIHLPHHVQLVCLSATVSNAGELAAWIDAVRGTTELIVETARPVELENRYVISDRDGRGVQVIPTLIGSKPNNRGFDYDLDASSDRRSTKKNGGRGKGQIGAALADPNPARSATGAAPSRDVARHPFHLQPRRLRRRSPGDHRVGNRSDHRRGQGSRSGLWPPSGSGRSAPMS